LGGKTEEGYVQIGNQLIAMREAWIDEERGKELPEGACPIPFEWISDGTRPRLQITTFTDIYQRLRVTKYNYAKNIWQNLDEYVEFYCEKDALSGVISPVCDECQVPLNVARGYSSLSFLWNNAKILEEIDKPIYIYHLGDFDPSGQDAARDIEAKLKRYAPDAEITFERLTVTQEQIEDWNLPSRPTKQKDQRAKGELWRDGRESVELDSIDPDDLRELARATIRTHISDDDLEWLGELQRRDGELLNEKIDSIMDDESDEEDKPEAPEDDEPEPDEPKGV
jgi:hypothetical protein